jgi:hypothetical protein
VEAGREARKRRIGVKMCGKVYPYNMKIAVSLILSNIELKYIKIFH